MEDLTGRQFGPYRIVAPLGEGGMAAVYKAYQPGMDRYVALKVLPRQLAQDAQFVGRFKQEARLIAQLVHPHILPIHDFGEADGYTYLVMPFIDGGTLKDRLAGQPLPLAHIQTIVTQLADALDCAHAQGIVHRDLKPSNVLMDQRGHCLLTDFGIARMVEGTTQYTQTGSTVGTPAYMSPEQGRGEKVDQRSDLYSLGVMLYELATGRVPFDAETPVAVIFKHIQDPLPPPRQLNPALPEGVERVIFNALAKSPADRFSTAGDMANALCLALSAAQTGTPAVPFDKTTLGTELPPAEAPPVNPALSRRERQARSAVRSEAGHTAPRPLRAGGALRTSKLIGGIALLAVLIGGAGAVAYFAGLIPIKGTAVDTPDTKTQQPTLTSSLPTSTRPLPTAGLPSPALTLPLALAEGWHDGADGVVSAGGCIASGWTVDPNNRDRDLQVRILSDGNPVTTTVAGMRREGVPGCPGGTCGFTVKLWGLITPGAEHQITAQAYDQETTTWVDVPGTPKSLTCWGYPDGSHDGADSVVAAAGCTAFGWAVDADNQDRDVLVRVLSDGREVASARAGDYAEDMDRLGICTRGTCRFTIYLTRLISAGKEHLISVQAYDEETAVWRDLPGTPKSLTCRP